MVRNFAVLSRVAARTIAARVVVSLRVISVFALASIHTKRTAPRAMRIAIDIVFCVAEDRRNVIAEFLGVRQAEIRLDGVALAVEKLRPKIIHRALTGRPVETGVFGRRAKDVLDFAQGAGEADGARAIGTLLLL